MSMDWVREELDLIAQSGLIRKRKALHRPNPGTLNYRGIDIIDFGSNDYLGLGKHPKIIAAACSAIKKYGAGSSASPLVTGYFHLHKSLEKALSNWTSTEDAIVFPSGFQANHGILSALVKPKDHIFCDELNHASLIDGCRQSRAKITNYRHNDLDCLESRILRSTDNRGRKWIVTDSVFSMDGDICKLDGLAELAKRHNAFIILDEAHATGVLGPTGKGLSEEFAINNPDWQNLILKIGTFSKALASQGGFACGNKQIIQLIKNKARSYMFSTSLNPGSAGAALEAIRILKSEPEIRIRLNKVILAFLKKIPAPFRVSPDHRTPIIPLILKDAKLTMRASRKLLDLGYLVPGIRPPSVPNGTSRLRISLKNGLTEKQLNNFTQALAETISDL